MAKISKRMAYQVVYDTGRWTNHIGYKGRLMSKRRANRVCKFLKARGLDVWVRTWGQVHLQPDTRLFD